MKNLLLFLTIVSSDRLFSQESEDFRFVQDSVNHTAKNHDNLDFTFNANVPFVNGTPYKAPNNEPINVPTISSIRGNSNIVSNPQLEPVKYDIKRKSDNAYSDLYSSSLPEVSNFSNLGQDNRIPAYVETYTPSSIHYSNDNESSFEIKNMLESVVEGVNFFLLKIVDYILLLLIIVLCIRIFK